MKSLNIIRNAKDGLKVLGKGELKSSVKVEAVAFSAKAKEAIEKVGGSVVSLVKEETPAKKTKSEAKEKQTRLEKKKAKKSAK